MLAGCWLGAGWELAGSWLRAITTMNPEYLGHLSISREGSGRLGVALRTEYPGGGNPGKSRGGVTLAGSEVLPTHRMLERSGGGILQLAGPRYSQYIVCSSGGGDTPAGKGGTSNTSYGSYRNSEPITYPIQKCFGVSECFGEETV